VILVHEVDVERAQVGAQAGVLDGQEMGRLGGFVLVRVPEPRRRPPYRGMRVEVRRDPSAAGESPGDDGEGTLPLEIVIIKGT
jgi:hypothetical protein